MKFKDFDRKMREFERPARVQRGLYMAARLDGRGFTKLTKNAGFEKPFDLRFNNLMVSTMKHLMQHSGMKFIYGYTQSDEISLLFSLYENSFNRKIRKFNSILASEASVYFSGEMRERSLGDNGIFDCRISTLETKEQVLDYFRWRAEDARRNSISSYCHWSLVNSGMSGRKAAKTMFGWSGETKIDFLKSEFGIDHAEVPSWSRKGTGMMFRTEEHTDYRLALGEFYYRNVLQPLEIENIKDHHKLLLEIIEGDDQ